MEEELRESILEFILDRCDNAIRKSKNYEILQSEECDRAELLDIAVTTGYIAGASDMLKIILKM